MNRKPSDSDLRATFQKGIAAVDVPRFDLGAIQARRGTVATFSPARSPLGRRAFIPVAVGLLVIAAIVPTMPAVIAQVQRALHAFAVVDGKKVPLTVRTVSLQEAQAQMPFRVIVPAAIPAGLTSTINALTSDASPERAHLIFQYHAANNEFPALTITESADRARSEPTQLMVTERVTKGGPPGAPVPDINAPPVMDNAPGMNGTTMRNVEMRVVNGHVTKRTLNIHPIMWVTGGTRIVLGAPDGTLTPSQLAAIRSAMSR